MVKPTYSALVAGGTGVVGQHVVVALAASDAYGAVTMLSRRAIDPPAPGVNVLAVDFEALCDGGTLLPADHVYICLGTTQKIAGSQAAFARVDRDYVVAVARAAWATRLALVSSVGADANSRNFYLRTKGEAEEAIVGLGFETLAIARPGLLRGPRPNDRRLGEELAKLVAPVVDPLLRGRLTRYRSIDPNIVAKALVNATLEGESGQVVLEHRELKRRANR